LLALWLYLLLGWGLRLQDFDRNRRETDDDKAKRQPAEHDPRRSQRNAVVGGRRMPRAGDKQQQNHQRVAELLRENHER